MNCIKVSIERLGRVRHSDIVVSPLMVFSGESGLGKSYIAIMCHYFFELLVNKSRLDHFFTDNGIDFNEMSKTFNDTGKALEIKKKDLEQWISDDVIHYLRYMLSHEGLSGKVHIELPETFPDTMVYTYKKELIGLVDAEDINTILYLGNLSFRVQENTQFDESPFSFLLRFVMVDFIFGNYQLLDSTFVFPPSRGPILTEQFIPTTGMYSEFLSDMTGLNRIKPRPDVASEVVTTLFNRILDGEVHKEDTTYIYTTFDTSMPVSAAAASVREIAPLQILAKRHDVSKCSILLEEPEAHLHPLKQRMMADIVGALCHNGAFMQITTHSDYFLRRLNELMMYHQVCHRGYSSEKIDEVSNKLGIVNSISIDPSIVSAYLLKDNGDGTSVAVKQDLSNGIPFSSFRDAVLANLNNQEFLDDFLQDGTE